MKLLLWVAIIVGVIWVLRSKKEALKAKMPAPIRPGDDVDAEPMLHCVHCGIHFPSSEAVTAASGEVFCGDEHRRLHAVR
jgi:uncharacterized protein